MIIFKGEALAFIYRLAKVPPILHWLHLVLYYIKTLIRVGVISERDENLNRVGVIGERDKNLN